MGSEDKPEKLAEGTLMSHLLELRNRLLKAVLAIFVMFIPCAIFANDLFNFIAQPLVEKLPAGSTLIATSVVGPFMTPFKVAFYVGLFAAMPVVLYQIWAFVAPGLYRKEKRFAVPLLVSSMVLFYVGVVFAYFVVFPVMFTFFVGTMPIVAKYTPDIAELPELRAHDVLRLRHGIRSAGRGGAAGADRPRQHREARATTAATW